MRLVLVGDLLFNGNIIKMIARELPGYQLVAWGDGRGGDICRERPDIVVIDLEPPEEEKVALLREIKGQDQGVYVLLLAGQLEQEGLEVALEMADDYLSVPVKPGELMQRLKLAARRRKYNVGLVKKINCLEETVKRERAYQEEAREALKEKAAEQALLLDNVDAQIWYLKDQETYGAVNQVHADFLGKEVHELEGQSLYGFLGPGEARACIQGNREVFRHKKQLYLEEWVKNSRGEERLLSIVKTPRLDDRGEVESCICTARDITERRQLEEVRHSEALRRSILESPKHIMIYSLDRDFNYITFNQAHRQAMQERWGVNIYPGMNMLGQVKDPREHTKARDCFQRALEGEHFTFYSEIPVKGSKYQQWELNLGPIQDDSGRVVGLTVFAWDISARLQAERALREKRNKDRQMHQEILPQRLPRGQGFSLAGHYFCGQRFGGNYYNALRLGNQVFFYLVETAQQGIDGIKSCSYVKKLIEEKVGNTPPGGLSPGEVLSFLAGCLPGREHPGERCLGIFLGLLDLRTYELEYSSVGYAFSPKVIFPGEDTWFLFCQGQPLSVDSELECREYPREVMQLPEKSNLFLASSGLADYEIEGKEVFRWIEENYQEKASLPPEGIVEILKERIRQQGNGFWRPGDASLLVLQRRETLAKLELELESDLEVMEGTEGQLGEMAGELGLNELDLLAIHEMLANAIEHGNKVDMAKKVSLQVEATERYVKIAIQDQGEGFNWRERLSREIDLEDFHDRGRGILLAKMFCDQVFYNEKGNGVTLVFKRGYPRELPVK